MVKRFTHDAPRCSLHRRDTTPACDAAVARALARDPAERFATARAFAEALTTSPSHTNWGTVAKADSSDLARVKGIRVLSRTSSMQLKGSTKPVRTLAQELSIRFVLAGSVRRAGNSLRITVELVDALTETVTWGEKFSGIMDDVFDVQERVAREIVKALGLTLTVEEDRRLADRPIKDVRAYEIYLRAQALVRRYGSSVAQVDALIDQAIEIEGLSPPLRALRAYLWVTQMRAGMMTGPEPLARAESEARILIELAPEAAYGYSLLGFISYERGDQAATVRYLTQALERDPSDADALFFRGIALEAASQGDAAIDAGRQFLYIAVHCPFFEPLRGTAEFDRILAKAERRVAEFSA